MQEWIGTSERASDECTRVIGREREDRQAPEAVEGLEMRQVIGPRASILVIRMTFEQEIRSSMRMTATTRERESE